MNTEVPPTHLGGELADKSWEELDAPGIIKAVGPSHVKAHALLPLVNQRLEAAREHNFTSQAVAYEYASWILSQLARTER